ncbi:MAG: hypothetical protein J0L84_06590 [Verrucomicrobia bacterium]|nr:hypothetical protein [Verrucomicrobiota bacterium]
MRKSAASRNGDFQLKVIAGTRTILMALNCPEVRRQGLRGFAFHRKLKGASEGKWLRSQKVFKTLVPDPRKPVDGKPPVFRTLEHPIQSFIWSDYTAEPGKSYEFRILPMYGKPGALKSAAADELQITIKTELEDDPDGHGIWFNRGAIASQQFALEFGNIKPSTQQLEDLQQPVTRWLSRGLVEACLGFINDLQPGDGLRACVYEFTYKPVLNALKAAVDRGVDVRICYHATPANGKAIEAAALPAKVGSRTVLYPRTVPKIPHNKFMVRLSGGAPVAVWTGSTNITPSGFLGQSNVGHLVRQAEVAAKFLKYWEAVAKDPQALAAKTAATRVTPHPGELLPTKSVSVLFSPRHRATMLQWYANRMLDATQTVMFTAAFGVNTKFVLPLAQDRDFLRFVLMEKRPTKELSEKLTGDRDLVVSYGAVLGETTVFQGGKIKKVRIKQFELDRWFAEEEHFRKSGHIFFVHTKFLLIDPLSDDPLVCSGSANFSGNSLTQNDENMLLIRGDKRVADIYLTEFDRIFRHFYFRDVANEIEAKGKKAEGAFLDETDAGKKNWTNSYFFDGAFKTRRRKMFFDAPVKGWADNAARRPADQTSKLGDKPV